MSQIERDSVGGQIPTTLRLLAVLEFVAARGVPVKAGEVIDYLGLPKPTVHRLLNTAEEEGFLQRALDGRSYGAGPRMRRLAVDTMSSEHLRTARLAVMNWVAEELGETCNLAVPDREGMTYLDRVETKWPLRIQLPIGTQVPFHCTASGKIYLSTLRKPTLDGYLSSAKLKAHSPKTKTDPDALRSDLEAIRGRGYSTDDEEFMVGMVAIAVPIRSHDGRLMATLAVHAPIQRRTLPDLIESLPVMNEAARKLASLHD